MPPVQVGPRRWRVKAGSSAVVPGSEPRITPPSNLPHQAASVGRRLGFWKPGGFGPNTTVALSGPELIRRSRDLRRNVPQGKRAMDLLTGHIVGIGIKPRSMCSNKRMRKELMKLWASWTAVADADNVLDFYGLQSLAVSEMIEAGESFCRLRARRLSDGLPVPLQLQLIPTEQLPLDMNRENGANRIVQGVETNPIGARVAYWFYRYHPNDTLVNVSDFEPKPVPAEDICHLYNVARIGQLRGLPWLATALKTLKQVDDYVDAELLRKQMTAAIVGFVETPPGEDVTPEKVEASFGTAITEEAIPAVTMEPGTIQYLLPGESVKFNTPEDVGATFDPFLAHCYRSVSSAANVLYEELTGSWKDINDRTFRAAFNTFRRMVSVYQYNLAVYQFSAPVWRRFVSYAVASGSISPPKSVDLDDLMQVSWMPHRHDYIQPVQDIQALQLEMQSLLSSRSGIIAERGDDAEDIDAQIKADQDREQSLGLQSVVQKEPAT